MGGYGALPKTEEKDEEKDAGTPLARGLRAAAGVLEPKATAIEKLVSRTDLPELQADDAVASLALRLDREADLWRDLAMREIARIGWADRIAQSAAVVALLADVGLAAVAALGALFGAENAGARALLLFGAAGAITLGAAVVIVTTAAVRRARHAVAREALARADVAELRLHRVGVVLAWRKQDPALYQEALARLERDAST